MKFEWRGPIVQRQIMDAIDEGLGEIGLRAETKAKAQLVKGHGVITGTLRRSTHCAPTTYAWRADNCKPSSGTPERGGEQVVAEGTPTRRAISLGSGMEYAKKIHDLYRWIAIGVELVRPDAPEILRRHVQGKVG